MSFNGIGFVTILVFSFIEFLGNLVDSTHFFPHFFFTVIRCVLALWFGIV
ncbi:unnamed protein product [Meloidogyne enterolobii]|uniref:Uncharacterized protein n=1 Tax=Meloidogyne enterolobii TaxID=390850 RepID=A0ACB0YQ85_MELEN